MKPLPNHRKYLKLICIIALTSILQLSSQIQLLGQKTRTIDLLYLLADGEKTGMELLAVCRKIQLNKTDATFLTHLFGEKFTSTLEDSIEIRKYKTDSTQLLIWLNRNTGKVSRFLCDIHFNEPVREIDYTVAQQAASSTITPEKIEQALISPGRVTIEDHVETWIYNGATSFLFYVFDTTKKIIYVNYRNSNKALPQVNEAKVITLTWTAKKITLDEIFKNIGQPVEITLQHGVQSYFFLSENCKWNVSTTGKFLDKIASLQYSYLPGK